MTEAKSEAPKARATKPADREKVDNAVADAQHDVAMALDAQHAEKVARQNARFAELGEQMSGDRK